MGTAALPHLVLPLLCKSVPKDSQGFINVLVTPPTLSQNVPNLSREANQGPCDSVFDTAGKHLHANHEWSIACAHCHSHKNGPRPWSPGC